MIRPSTMCRRFGGRLPNRGSGIERYVQLNAPDVVFHLDAAPLATTTLTAGDALTDSHGQSYLVLFTERQTLGNTVAIVCRLPGS